MADDDEDEVPDIAETVTTGDVGDPKQAKKQKAKAKRETDQQIVENKVFWSQCLSVPYGRRILWQILHDDLHFEEVRFGTVGAFQLNEKSTWMALGEQLYGQRLFNSLLQYDRDGVYLMLDENDPRFRPDKRQRGNRSDGRSG